MFEDLELNSIPDFHDYAEAVGETYAPLYMADIMHEDLIGMKTTGRFSDTPYIRNLMVSGSEDKATLIDFEDAHLGEDPPKKDLGDVSIRELIPADREDEYEALEAALFSEAIRDFSSFWDQIAGHEIVKPEFVDHDHFKNLDFVNIDKFTRIFSSNQDIQEEVREIQNSFERGFDSGCRNNGKKQFYQRTNPSAIDINHSPADDLRTAARKRLDSDIEPFVQETLTELETTPVDEA